MDADVVGFQEVVSIDALKADCAAAGYPHFATIAEPRIREAEDGSGRLLYTRPVQALAARWPLTAAALRADHAVSRTLGLASDREFRRPPVRAVVQTPVFGPVVVYACHLKSPGVGIEDAQMAGAQEPPEAPEARARWTLQALSRAHGAAAIQRLFEASQLYHAAAADIAEAPDRPVAIMGDLNDTPDSAALAALTPFRAFERDGGDDGAAAEAEAEDADFAAGLARYRLLDAFRLSPRARDRDGRPATHRAGARGETLDFILVSAALQPEQADARVKKVAHFVHDRHFFAGQPSENSDHAGVSAVFEAAGA